MANTNPWQARLKRHANRSAGSIDELLRRAWGVLMISLEDVGTDDAEARRKAVLAFWQGAGVYKGLMEVAELENRVAELERLMGSAGRVA